MTVDTDVPAAVVQTAVASASVVGPVPAAANSKTDLPMALLPVLLRLAVAPHTAEVPAPVPPLEPAADQFADSTRSFHA